MLPISQYLKKPNLFFLSIVVKCGRYIKSDRLYLKLRYYLTYGQKLNLKNPTTFNEKLNWLKLYNRQNQYTMMVDKFGVKEYVTRKIGAEYIIPTLGVWNSPEEIDFNSLPNQFVLKTTHGGGGCGVVICTDKLTFDKEFAIAKLKQAMKADIYTDFREWPYKDVPRRIIAEQYMVDDSINDLRDYKFFCFNGKVRFCKVDFNRFMEHHANYYDTEWNILPFGEEVIPPIVDKKIDCPKNFDKMLEIAQKLSQGIPFVRIDLYNIQGEIFFGEITFFPAGGMGKFTPQNVDKEIGQFIVLPKN